MRANLTLTKIGLVAILLTCATLVGCLSCFGCAPLDAWKAGWTYNHKTGEAGGDIKGAGSGGQYQENKGLNLSLGDNSIAGLIIAGTLLVTIVAAYPLQRALRLRKEQKWLEYYKRQNGHSSVSFSPSHSEPVSPAVQELEG